MGRRLPLILLLAAAFAAHAQQQDSGKTSPAQPAAPAAHAPKKFVPPEPPVPVVIPDIELLPPPPPIPGLTPYSPPSIPFVGGEYLLGRSRESLPPPEIPAVVRVLIGLVALLVLSYLAGSTFLQKRLDEKLNVPHLVTTGLPFFVLGFIASQPQVGVLTPSVLHEIAPIMPLALGWIGYAIGSRFRAEAVERLPLATGNLFVATTAIPLAIVFTACTIGILMIQPAESREWAFRDALLLATAGAMAARNTPHFFRVFSKEGAVSPRTVRAIELEQLAGVFVLLMVSAYYRPGGQLVNWQLPGTAWLFVTIGIGATMGLFVYLALTRISRDPQYTVVLLGSIAFTAGMASFLRLSPLAVCAITGLITANLGDQWRDRLCANLERLERPVYFLFMVIAGALWHPSEWRGWALMLVFILSRVLSKWFASDLVRRIGVKDMTADERRASAWAPMGALSVAIVVSAQDLYSGPTISWIVTAVVAGALLSEVGLQIAARRARQPRVGSPAYQGADSGGVD